MFGYTNSMPSKLPLFTTIFIGHRYDKCTWISPKGKKCVLLHKGFEDKFNCMAGIVPAWENEGTGNCSIRFNSVAHENNGEWKVIESLSYTIGTLECIL